MRAGNGHAAMPAAACASARPGASAPSRTLAGARRHEAEALEIGLVGIGVDGSEPGRTRKPFACSPIEGDFQRIGDGAGNLFLDQELVVDVALAGLGPEEFIALCIDELNGNTDLVVPFSDTALHDHLDAQLLGQFRQGKPLVTVTERRGA